MRTSFSDFIQYIRESEISELNEAIVIRRDFLRGIGGIVKPLFLELAEMIDENTKLGDLYGLLSNKEMFRLIGIDIPIIKKILGIQDELKGHINAYIKREYLDGSDLTNEEQVKVLLQNILIEPDGTWISDDFDIMKILHKRTSSGAFRGGKESLIQKIMSGDDEIKGELEAEFERFSTFIDFSSGAGFGQRTKAGDNIDDNPNINDLYFAFNIKFNFSLILFYTFVILSKYGYLNRSIEEMVDEFVRKRVVPFIAHEITHFIQKLKSILSTKRLMKISSYKSPDEIESQEEFDDWLIGYLSEPIEIGAHASEFVETLLATYPDKSYGELLNMIKVGDVPIATSQALRKYFEHLRELTGARNLKREWAVNRFKKTVFKILKEYEDRGEV